MYHPCRHPSDRIAWTESRACTARSHVLSDRITPLTIYSLPDLGWSDHFARQLTEDDAHLTPARISEVHRTQLVALTTTGETRLHPNEAASAYAVGDWVLTKDAQIDRRLTPTTDLHRKAAGHTHTDQRIAANVDTVGL